MPPIEKPKGQQADAAVERVAELADDELVDDETLKRLLDPFRGHRPLRMRCPRTGCGRTIVWCAVHPTVALAVFYNIGPRKGHVETLSKNGPHYPIQQQPPAPFNYWSLGPSGGNDSARPATLSSAEHNRWTFTCQKCHRDYTVTNRTLLTKIITALTGNRKEFTP